ncbi:L-aspartate oxidase (plasmid) [Cereibacter azotoformans]|uniref:L-aspartate oxidase n=1 Tax=Cereibacter azotoformans TaxID=43057 RepID=UPI001EE9B7AA|nr:L-aspartate oxidase [Cereibacter azotoformans]ULB12360.1 L-aspartate oxidase [Cereibacter azotoformans]
MSAAAEGPDTGRVIVVGAGIAGLYAALHLAPHPVLVISPEPLGEGASSAWAQGGIAAAIGPGDSPADHAADTVRAGAGTVVETVAASVTAEARAHILELTRRGAPFDRDARGGYVLSREAAHSRARVVRVKGDQAGREIMATLVAEVRRTASVQVLEGVSATGLAVEAGRVTGVTVTAADGHSGAVALRGTAVLLAGGGAAGLYARTTNPPRVRGQALGMAARAGAMVADAEFVQFHPTAIDTGEDPAPLATEALRGEGARLIDRNGRRFMASLHPDAELAPRDVVARAIFAAERDGLRPALDTRGCLGEAIDARFPEVASACRRAGIDPVAQPIPVTAAAHYHMGGVEVTGPGRSSLPGLWVVGEASATGLHGANRLASNGLLEALVYARRAAADMAERLGAARAMPSVALILPPGGRPVDPEAVAILRRLMSEHVGVVRTAEGLRTALRGIAALERDAPPAAFLNMTAAATLIAAAALLREESRGGHFRSDFPLPRDGAGRSRLTLAEAMTLRDTL